MEVEEKKEDGTLACLQMEEGSTEQNNGIL